MKQLFSFITVTAFAAIVLFSCKKDYQKASTEFIRNLPDSCEFLIAVDNDAEHLVYYKEPQNKCARSRIPRLCPYCYGGWNRSYISSI